MKHDSSWALRRVLKSLGRYLPLLIVSLVLAAASVAGTLYIPILVGDAIDAVVGPGQVDFAAVGMLAAKIAVLAAGTALLQWVMAAIHNRVCFAVTRDVRRQAFAHLQRLPLAYLDSHPAGDTLSRMIADVDQFADGLLMGFTQLFTGVLTIVGTLGFMLSISVKITLVVVVLTPLSLLVVGSLLAGLSVGKVFASPRLWALTAVRLLVLPALLWLLLGWMNVEPPMVAGIAVILMAMPTAVNGSMLSMEYGGDTECMAQITFLTTLVSIITIPVVSALL